VQYPGETYRTSIAGSCFDPETRRLYVYAQWTQRRGMYDQPVVHVYRVKDDGADGIDDIPQAKALKARMHDGRLHVSGLTVGKPCSVYTISGALVHHNMANSDEADVTLPVRGLFIVKSGDAVVKTVY
jgi:hypothetical protein